MIERIVCLLIGYVFGSFLTAAVVSDALEGTSIFELGDGNPGMANVARELGPSAAFVCLFGDILKTILAITMCHALFPTFGSMMVAWAGLGSTIGHCFPFWNSFRGGKGVVTIITTMILINPVWGLTCAFLGLLQVLVTGYLSVGAVTISACYLIAMAIGGNVEYIFVSAVFLVLTVRCHGSKLRGIIDGTTEKVRLFK